MPIAIIPARGGSKRIPRKNIRNFCGTPMLERTVKTIQSSGLFEKIIVSTDDEEIAEIAISSGAEVPFLRPSHLSDDYTSTKSVIQHCLSWANQNQVDTFEACCVYPATPLMTSEMLIKGLALLRKNQGCQAVFPAVPFAHPIQRAIFVADDGLVYPLDDEQISRRTQDAGNFYHDAGQFYWARHSVWMNESPILGEGAIALTLTKHSVIDIDDEEDWLLAELLFASSHGQKLKR